MICSMCNSEIAEGSESDYKISTPEGMQREVCGRCYMLVKINDTLAEILVLEKYPRRELKDGRPRIA